jgi:hypothetical protein
MSQLYSNLHLPHLIQEEWDAFWSWMWFNTGQHGIGPLREKNFGKDEQAQQEQEMAFFLKYKARILRNPPTGDEFAKFMKSAFSK